MEKPVDAPAARQDKGLQRRQIFLAPVHELLELLHLALADAKHPFVGGIGWRAQLAAEIEELVLDLPQDLVKPAMSLPLDEPLGVDDAHQADNGVERVDGAGGAGAR